MQIERCYEISKGALVLTTNGTQAVVCGYNKNRNTLVLAIVRQDIEFISDNTDDVILIPAYENWRYGYLHETYKSLLFLKRTAKTININTLYTIYDGFSFYNRGADLIGNKENQSIIIEDAFCKALHWLVHEYTNYDKDNEVKTFEGRVWL